MKKNPNVKTPYSSTINKDKTKVFIINGSKATIYFDRAQQFKYLVSVVQEHKIATTANNNQSARLPQLSKLLKGAFDKKAA